MGFPIEPFGCAEVSIVQKRSIILSHGSIEKRGVLLCARGFRVLPQNILLTLLKLGPEVLHK